MTTQYRCELQAIGCYIIMATLGLTTNYKFDQSMILYTHIYYIYIHIYVIPKLLCHIGLHDGLLEAYELFNTMYTLL